jgi:hypothetical protein
MLGPALFAVTLFTSAALLFFVQPMIGKMLLPHVGGAPAVWNTCMLFFQAALLAGYAYAHATTAWLGVRKQAALHLSVLALPLLALPLAVPAGWSPGVDENPVPRLLALLLVSVGLPFFAVSTSAPLLQRWFANTGHARARDPYFLYAASNAGSLLALLAYPFVLEPLLPLRQQAFGWAVAYGLLLLFTLTCAVVVWRHAGTAPTAKAKLEDRASGTESPPWPSRLRWVALAFVPASLLLGVTTHLTTDVTPVPLLWVLPLAVYLLSFILAFGPLSANGFRAFRLLLPPVALLQAYFLVVKPGASLGLLLGVNLATLFVVSTVCHGELARTRPAARMLTEFYLWVSVGGVLGGVFNALVAPLVFSWLVEYPLVLVLACLLMPAGGAPPSGPTRVLDWVLPATLGLVAAGTLFLTAPKDVTIPFAVLVLLGLALATRPLRLGLGLAVLLLVGFGYTQRQVSRVFRERNFYGVLWVWDDGNKYFLMHGSTIHGAQRRSEDPRVRDLPLLYYHPSGPAGQVFEAFFRTRPKRRVGVVGLGAGTLASYGEAGQEFTFYELDPGVIRLASASPYFTYLRDSAARIRIVPGDARLSLAREPDAAHDLLVIDAFSGDSIPSHLLTKEAVRLYLEKLTGDGLILMHITNRYLDLGPVVSNLAAANGLLNLAQYDEAGVREQAVGKLPSYWVALARRAQDFGPLAGNSRWRELPLPRDTPVWTDDYSNLFGAVKRR